MDIKRSLSPPHIIEATYRIVTPMFLGDAQQEASSISPQSVKGALRFWWRALMWGHIRSDSRFNTDELALKELHKREAELFGLAIHETIENGKVKTIGGQSKFSIQVLPKKYELISKDNVHPNFKNYTAARYFGYGLMEAFPSKKNKIEAGHLKRSCIQPNQTFTVTLTFHLDVEPSIQEALIVMGLLGGLGSRVRRGMGSIQLETLTQIKFNQKNELFSMPKTTHEYKEAITKYIRQYKVSMPFSTFTTKTRIDCLAVADNPFSALNELAKGMMLYRSWGKDGKVLNQDREGNFKPDHDWKYNNSPKDFHPRRVMFGLPHNYGQGTALAVSPEIQKKPYPTSYYKHDRRASPLWLHVHQIGSEFLGISILFPSDFLPKGEKINAGGTNVPTRVDWTVLTDFLDGTIKLEKNGKLRFPTKKVLLSGEKLI